jgi:transcriptional regulator with XRE-family HTH domain/energy-coupling factor transporter ATP-binding protein EcfA2
MSVEERVPNERLRHARSLKGWSQAKLAEEVGTSYEMVSRWERGITVPTLYFRAHLCAALGMTAEELGLVHDPSDLLGIPTSPFVFLACSYADSEKAVVTRIKTVLQKRGIPLWSSRHIGRHGLEQPRKALGEVVRAAQVLLLIVSPEARSSRHIREALEVGRMYRRPVYGVWIEGEDWQECLPQDEQELSARIDARISDDSNLFEEVVTLLQQGLSVPETTTTSAPGASQEQVPAGEPRNPYKGLQAFRQEDHRDFFGRDALIDKLTSTLAGTLTTERGGNPKARLLAIIGPSGSGKSSLMMAGLLPRLQQGRVPGSQAWIYLGPIVPGSHPLESLALALTEQLPDRSLLTLRQDLEEDSARGLHQLATALTQQQGTRVLLCVDQFEELFTQTSAQEERQQFLELLVTALTEPRGPVIVVLTLRADFYDRLLSCSVLVPLIEQHQCVVPPMNIQELRMVIEQPARLPDVQLTFEGDLVGDLLFEMQGQAEALPLLQFTLEQLFQQRRGSQFTLEAYQEIGGVKGALVRHAESTYASFPSEEHRKLARTLFLRLIEPGASEQDTTRRRAARSELELSDPKETALLEEVSEAFIKARLLTSTTVAGTAVLEVSHEALIREWPRLADWLQDAREDIRLQQTISEDATSWQERGKSRDRLYRGHQLVEAQAWARRNSPSRNEMAFLRASQQRRLQFGISVLAIVLVLLATAGLAGWLSLHLPPDPTRVTTLQDNVTGSLRWAIENAPPGSTITFDASLHGTLRLTDKLQISKQLTIRGPGAGRLALNGRQSYVTGIEVSPTGTVTIADLAFKSSYIYSSGTLTLIHSIVSGDSAYGGGQGSIYIDNGSRLTLINSTVSDNLADTDGGGMSNEGTLTLINSIVSGNRAGGFGGGILNGGTLTLINSTVSGNRAGGFGGGIYNDNGTLTLTNSTVSGNTAYNGGGIYNYEGRLTLTNSTVSGNTTQRDGFGGGIYNDNDSTLMLINSTISGNRAQRPGGGILNSGLNSRTEMIFCTIYDNTSGEGGGGIWNGVTNSASQLVMKNSLVAGNKAPSGPDILGMLTSQGYNLIQSTQGTKFAPNQEHGIDLLQVAPSALEIDPLLRDNKGPTQTHALLPGSAAIDRIPLKDCRIKDISTDQRGVRRPQGVACDIGAYELRE